MKQIIILAVLILASLSQAQASDKPALTCNVSISDYSQPIGKTLISTQKVTFDVLEVREQVKTIKTKYQDQEIQFVIAVENFTLEKSLILEIFDSWNVDLNTGGRDFIKHSLAATDAQLPATVDSSFDASLDTKVPNTELISAGVVCVGGNE